MAFRHPPPWLYAITFGAQLVVGIISASDVWRKTSGNKPIFIRIALTLAAVIAPLAGILLVMSLICFVLIHLGTPRKGNRMIVTGGEHKGKTVIVTRRYGLTDPGWGHVQLLDDRVDTTISPDHLKKIGLLSHLY